MICTFDMVIVHVTKPNRGTRVVPPLNNDRQKNNDRQRGMLLHFYQAGNDGLM